MSQIRIGCLIALTLGFVGFRPSIAQDGLRDRLVEAKDQVDGAFQKYVASGQDPIAMDALVKGIHTFESLCQNYSSEDKNDFLLHLGKLKLKVGESQSALQWFEAIERDGAIGSEQRVEAKAFLFFLRTTNGMGDVKTGLDVLSESVALEATNRKLYDDLQFSILEKIAVSDPLSRTESSSSIETRHRKLDQEIAALEVAMIESGLSADIVKLAQFGRVALVGRNEDFEMLHRLLSELQPAVESPFIAPQWKALLWNKWVDLHIKQRNYGAALSAHRKFEEAAEQTGNVELAVVSHDQKALLYLRMGDYTNARRLLEETRLFQLQNPILEQSMNWRINMSKALEGDREFLRAREILVEGLGILSDDPNVSSLASASALKTSFLNNLGVSHYLTGDLEQASALLEKSRVLVEEQAMSHQLIAAESMINQGWIALARKQPENAVRFFDDAAKRVAEIATEGHVRYAEALTGASRAYLALGDPKKAAVLIRRAEELAYQKLLLDLQSVYDPRDRIAILQETRVHPESIAWPGIFDSYLELAAPLALPVAEQLDVVLRWKGVLGRLENIAERKQLFQSLADVHALEKQLSEVYFRRVSVLQKKKQLQEIKSIEDQLQNLRRQQIIPHSRQPQAANGSHSETLIQSLPVDSGVVSIVQIRTYRQPGANQTIGSSGEFLGFVAAGGKLRRVSLGEASELESAVAQWIKYITDQHPEERLAASRVAKLVQAPLLPHVGNLERLVIHADGVCHSIPWGALPGVAKSHFWVEDVLIENALDLTLADTKPVAQLEPSLLVVGDVDYGPLRDSWPELPATRNEILGVQSTFTKRFPVGGIASLSKGQADKPSVTDRIADNRFVHFATHGLYLKRGDNDAFGLIDATSSLDTGLVLAASQEGQSPASQYLTASEVMTLDLDKVELVVLSACETGLGKSKAGQGIDGLVYSFHSAGVRQVVSSLWKVGDNETKELMTRFYKNLWLEGLSPGQALRKAQKDLFQNADWSQPVAWAAFTVSARELSR